MNFRIPEIRTFPDSRSAEAVAARAAVTLRPRGSLARLDEIAVWLAGWQRSVRPKVERPAVCVFVADHGVAEEGVSAYPAEVTASVFKALQEGVATAPALAREAGALFQVVDAGVGNPTANFLTAPALDEIRFRECFDLGRETVSNLDADLLVVGEMGIGNTTAASALTAALLGCPEECTGRGTGVTDELCRRKIRVVQGALSRVGAIGGSDGLRPEPLEILRQLGGSELVAAAGAVVEARLRSIPVVLDGFVVTAAVAPIEFGCRGSLDHCLAGHLSSEPGHWLLLDRLGKRPLIDLGLRLGEGSGAILTIPLIKLAAAAVTDVATFEEWGLDQQ